MAVSHAHAAPVDGDDPACFEGFKRGVCRLRTGLDAKVGSTRSERVDDGISTLFEIAAGDGRPHRVGDDCRGEDFVQATDGGHDRTREVQYLAARGRIYIDGDRRAKCDESSGLVSDCGPYHLRQFAAKWFLRALHALTRQDVVLKHEVVTPRPWAALTSVRVLPAARHA